jgi:very-short-patch-repair endonuclease
VRGRGRKADLPWWTTERARKLRREATDAEKRMWRALREAFPHAKFRRQQALGLYFADFASHAARLVIEIDGGQHGEAIAYDEARTRFITGEGYRVIRFWNDDVVTNIEGVLAQVDAALTPSPSQG